MSFSSRLRSRNTFWAPSGSSQSFGSSARSFSSARRRFATSQSKMPPQQRQRLRDVVDDRLYLGAHYAHPPSIPDTVRQSRVPFGDGESGGKVGAGLPGQRARSQ